MFFGEATKKHSFFSTTLHYPNSLNYKNFEMKIFTAYLSIIFTALLIGRAGVNFQASLIEKSPGNNPISFKVNE